MELVAVVAIITLGFGYISHLHSKHTQKLELLLKASDLQEVKTYEHKEVVTFEEATPETIVEAFGGKTPDEIRAAFRTK